MRLFNRLFCFIVILIAQSSAFALEDLYVTPLGSFEVNQKVKLQVEFTSISKTEIDLRDFGQFSLSVAEDLQRKFPDADEVSALAQNSWTFSTPLSSKPWKIEVDGHLKGRPIVEVTTPPLKPAQVVVFDQVIETLTRLPMAPQKDVGGGHIRVRVKKRDVTPQMVARFFQLYYSYFDIINFTYRHPKRNHATAAPTMDEKSHFDSLDVLLKKLSVNNMTTYEELLKSGMTDANLERIGSWMRSRNILLAQDHKAYDKYFDFNLGRLYASYKDSEKDSLHFEFRLFDAPLNAEESRQHLKFLLRLFNRAFNKEVNYERKHHGYMNIWKTNEGLYQRNLQEFLQDLDGK